MSHVTTIDLFISDLDSLAKACERLGLELVKGQKTFKWFGRWMNDYAGQDAAYKQGIDTKDYGKCEHAIKVKGNARAYEIGLVKRNDGKAGYRLVWDNYAGGLGLCGKVQYNEKTKTPNADKLKDWYAAEVSKKQMRRQGFRVNAFQREGKVEVLCSK